MTMLILLIYFLVRTEFTFGFSSGAPLTACEGEMIPRHGFEPQEGDPPIQLVTDEYTMFSHQYLRVTIRSKRAFKGFLIRAASGIDSHLGTWYIPYLDDTSYLSESSYLHCGGKMQSAVTHSGRTNTMFVLSLQWKPPAEFHGKVVFEATVVENYRVYWLGVVSSPVYVIDKDSDKDSTGNYEVKDQGLSTKKTSFYNEDTNQREMNSTNVTKEEDFTVSSIFHVEEHDLSDSDPVFKPLAIIDKQEKEKIIDNGMISEHERPRTHHQINLDKSVHDLDKLDVTEESTENVTDDIVDISTDITNESKKAPISGSSLLSRAIPEVISSVSTTTASIPPETPFMLLKTTTTPDMTEMSSQSAASMSTTKSSAVSTSEPMIIGNMQASLDLKEMPRNSNNFSKADEVGPLSPTTTNIPTFQELPDFSTENIYEDDNQNDAEIITEAVTEIPETKKTSVQTESDDTKKETTKNNKNFTTKKTFAVTSNKSMKSPRPKIIEPTFIFTTDSPTRKSREINAATSSTINNQKYSHFFTLTELNDTAMSGTNNDYTNETVEDIDLSNSNDSLLDTLMYTFEKSDRTENDEMTEVIIISNFTELERMPRDNDDTSGEVYEGLEGPYQRLQARYGGWENTGRQYKSCVQLILLMVSSLLL